MNPLSTEAETIQQRMQQVRTNLGVEMRDLVVNVRTMTDWRYYWRENPGVWILGAFILGYYLVPPRRLRHADVQHMTGDVAQSQARLTTNSKTPGIGRRLIGELAGLAVGFAFKQGLRALEASLTNAGQESTPAPRTLPANARRKAKGNYHE
jgi:hypothetical protein